MSQYKKDLISSFLFLIFGALVVAAVPLTIKDPKISVMGPRVFPYFIGICMILLSLALLAVTLVKHYKENVGETAAKECSPEVRRAALRDELRGFGGHHFALLRLLRHLGILRLHPGRIYGHLAAVPGAEDMGLPGSVCRDGSGLGSLYLPAVCPATLKEV